MSKYNQESAHKELPWIAKVVVWPKTGTKPIWFGTLMADSREEAKRLFPSLVAEYLGLNAVIVSIAKGRVYTELLSEEVLFEDV